MIAGILFVLIAKFVAMQKWLSIVLIVFGTVEFILAGIDFGIKISLIKDTD